MKSFNLINHLERRTTYSLLKWECAKQRNEGSCLRLPSEGMEKLGWALRLQGQSQTQRQRSGSGISIREPSRGPKLTLIHASYPLSCESSQKALRPQSGLSGSGMLSLTANLPVTCACCPVRTQLPGRLHLVQYREVTRESQPEAGSDDRREETPLLKFLDILWNFPAQKM